MAVSAKPSVEKALLRGVSSLGESDLPLALRDEAKRTVLEPPKEIPVRHQACPLRNKLLVSLFLHPTLAACHSSGRCCLQRNSFSEASAQAAHRRHTDGGVSARSGERAEQANGARQRANSRRTSSFRRTPVEVAVESIPEDPEELRDFTEELLRRLKELKAKHARLEAQLRRAGATQ